eukprot:1161360-Pelagomonas_calceolata.AAC.3
MQVHGRHVMSVFAGYEQSVHSRGGASAWQTHHVLYLLEQYLLDMSKVSTAEVAQVHGRHIIVLSGQGDVGGKSVPRGKHHHTIEKECTQRVLYPAYSLVQRCLSYEINLKLQILGYHGCASPSTLHCHMQVCEHEHEPTLPYQGDAFELHIWDAQSSANSFPNLRLAGRLLLGRGAAWGLGGVRNDAGAPGCMDPCQGLGRKCTHHAQLLLRSHASKQRVGSAWGLRGIRNDAGAPGCNDPCQGLRRK